LRNSLLTAVARCTAWAALLLGGVSSAAAAERASVLAAAKDGTAAELAALLAAGGDPNEADADGTSALHWAVHRGAGESMRTLLAAGAAVDAANRYGVRPTYLAAENGDAAALRALLAAGADPHAVFAEGETLLMTAARTGEVQTIEALLAAGADVDAREGRGGQTALMAAAAKDNGGAIAALLAAGAERDAHEATGELTALAFAVRAGAVDAARTLLEGGADPSATLPDGTSLLVLAALNQSYEAAALLLEHGADPNAAVDGWTALHQIARVRRSTRGFNLPGPEHRDQLSSLELVRKLAAHGADVNARQSGREAGTTPFLLATRSLDLAYMRTLLELGADPKLAADDGTTAVMVAAGVGQGQGSAGAAPGSLEEALAALKLTLELGAGTVNDVNSRNETPLHGVMYRGGAIALIDFLAAHGATLEPVVNSRGWTALRIADGVALDGVAFIRYPESAAHLRALMRAKGLPVPPVESDGPRSAAAQ
jgi:ankyrin repeat protein